MKRVLFLLVILLCGCASGKFSVGDCLVYSNTKDSLNHLTEKIETKEVDSYTVLYYVHGEWFQSAVELEFEYEDDFEKVSCP